jgi:hypothetical protein
MGHLHVCGLVGLGSLARPAIPRGGPLRAFPARILIRTWRMIAFHKVCDALLLKGDVEDPMTEIIVSTKSSPLRRLASMTRIDWPSLSSMISLTTVQTPPVRG